MGTLATFSIETDTTVLLTFDDGRQERVQTRLLSKILSGDDLAKVRKALKLRKDFWRQHLPKTSLAVGLAASLLLVGVAGTDRMAELAHHRHATTALQQAPDNAKSASTAAPTPTNSPTPSGALHGQVAGASTKTATPPGQIVRATHTSSSTTPASMTDQIKRSIGNVTKPITKGVSGLLGL